MSTSYEAPQQHSQPSRKGKKAWRKYVDVSDVQTGLEQVRAEEIKGYVMERFKKMLISGRGVIAEKPSEALFSIDAVGAAEIQKAYHKIYKPLKSDEILAQRSAIPAVDTRKRSKTTDGVLEKPTKRRKTNGVSMEKLEKLRLRAYGGNTVVKNVIDTDGVPSHDPWEDIIKVSDPRFSFLEWQKPIVVPSTLSEAPISLLQSKRAMRGVTKPNPGTSYNPTFQDWDDLLAEEGRKEIELEKKRIQEEKEEAELRARIEAAQNERDPIHTEDESAWEGFESEIEIEAAEWIGKKRPERKSQSDRNRIKRRKEAERETKRLAGMKRKKQQVEQIRSIAGELQAKDQSAAALALLHDSPSSDDELDDRILRRRKLGRTQYVDSRIHDLLRCFLWSFFCSSCFFWSAYFSYSFSSFPPSISLSFSLLDFPSRLSSSPPQSPSEVSSSPKASANTSQHTRTLARSHASRRATRLATPPQASRQPTARSIPQSPGPRTGGNTAGYPTTQDVPADVLGKVDVQGFHRVDLAQCSSISNLLGLPSSAGT